MKPTLKIVPVPLNSALAGADPFKLIVKFNTPGLAIEELDSTYVEFINSFVIVTFPVGTNFVAS